MTDGENTQQTHDSRHPNCLEAERELMERPAGEDPPLPEGVFHLVAADSDLTDRVYQRKITLCGAWLSPSDLPPPCWGGDEIGDREPRFCPKCAREAARWSAEGAGASSGGVR
ncbi:MAG TPA: hypothetical protein VFO16_13420 [Pseudonocardiaceae bacterium]|nr:hypothetical protein [Pseudonocardiaceae bacterium]